MYSKISLFTVASLFVISNLAYGQTTQELGLPSPVAYEAVFPNVSFGGGEVELRCEIVLSNPTATDAFVELRLYDSSGQEAERNVAGHRARGSSAVKTIGSLLAS